MEHDDTAATIRGLEERLAVQEAEVRALRGRLDGDPRTATAAVRSRRDLLRNAGFAAAGLAAGGAALNARPVLAANPPLLLDQNNPSTAQTQLSGTSGFGVFSVDARDMTTNSTTALVSAGQGGNGFGGLLVGTNGALGAMASSNGGVDQKGAGSGRLALASNNAGSLFGNAAAPSGGVKPAYRPSSFWNELVPGQSGELWYGWTFHPTSGPDTTYWRRLNTVRFDSGTGDGSLFNPYRALDTRQSIPLIGGTIITLQIAPVAQGVSAHGIPHTAVGIVGNLTAVSPTYSGYLTIFPAGAPNPGTSATPTSTVNFVANGAPTPNSFVVGLGGGSVSIFANNPAVENSVQVLLDITGYIE